MNIIPLTFNERQINATILGGKETPLKLLNTVGIILLNKRGSHYRFTMLENLTKQGFEHIVSIEKDPKNYNIEDFAQSYPNVKFLVPLDEVTDGDCINLGMAELNTEYVLVLNDNFDFRSEILYPRVAQSIMEAKIFCTVPRLLKKDGSSFPSIFMPSANGAKFEIVTSSHISENSPCVYAFDNIGIYNREKFIQLGGFDYTIKNPYYQTLDLCLRSWLWGEEIKFSTVFKLNYLDDPPIEDLTTGLDSSRFYLKNLLPHYVNDHAVIRKRNFLSFYFHSRSGLCAALEQFKLARQWVKLNRYRFKCDIGQLIDNWGIKK